MVGLDMKKYLVKPQTLQSILILNFMIWYGGGTKVIKTALLRILNGWPSGLAFPTGLEVTRKLSSRRREGKRRRPTRFSPS